MAQFFLGNLVTYGAVPSSLFVRGVFFYDQTSTFQFRVFPTQFANYPQYDGILIRSDTSRELVFKAQVKGIYFISYVFAIGPNKPYTPDFEVQIFCSKKFGGRFFITPALTGGVQMLSATNLVELDLNEEARIFVQFSVDFPGVQGAGDLRAGLFNVFLVKETT